jgi:UDP-glucose 4-epimerase
MTDNTAVMIVGGAGAVGSCLVNALRPRALLVVDRAYPAHPSQQIRFLHCDLSDWGDVERVKNQVGERVVVVYLAASLDPEETGEHTGAVLRDTVVGLGNFLSAFGETMRRFIYLSSVSVYGRPQTNPVDENHPVQPYSVYGVSKASAELLAQAVCGRHGVPLTIVRVTQLFGISSADSSLPHRLLSQMRSKELPRITCDPAVQRDYLHAQDLVDFLVRVIDHPVEGVFNAGSGSGIRIDDLFRLFFQSFGEAFEESRLLRKPLDPSFTQILSIDKARNMLGFKPRYPIQQWIADAAREIAV